MGSAWYWLALLAMVAGFGGLLWRRGRLAPQLELQDEALLVWQRASPLGPPRVVRAVPRGAVRAVEVQELRLDALRRRWQVRLLLAGGEAVPMGAPTAREAMARRPAQALAAALGVELR